MNIKKIEKQLRKLNQLFETIKEDGSVSAIEKDLMLSYVRGLYEKIIESQDSSKHATIAKSHKTKEKIEVQEVIKEKVKDPVQDNIVNVVMQEVVESNITAGTPEPNTVSSTSAPQISSFQETVAQEVVESPALDAPQEILDLFEFESTNELSDKLSRAPIEDLTKCMGINEKIFTVKELFGGDSSLFTKAMETMDKFTSLEQARDYLVEVVAVDQNWASEVNLKKATKFIKLISRRY